MVLEAAINGDADALTNHGPDGEDQCNCLHDSDSYQPPFYVYGLPLLGSFGLLCLGLLLLNLLYCGQCRLYRFSLSGLLILSSVSG
jgi:hypothetical protein